MLFLFLVNNAYSQILKPHSHSSSKKIQIDVQEIKELLEFQAIQNSETSQTLDLPLSTFSSHRFLVKENQILSPDLASKFPQIKTYRLISATDPGKFGSLTINGNELEAFLVTDNATLVLKPDEADNTLYTIESSLDSKEAGSGEFCNGTHELTLRNVLPELPKTLDDNPLEIYFNGAQRKSFRVAIVTTGEFYRANGNNDQDVLGAVTTTLNGVSAIYERELSFELQLSGIEYYKDPATDPFTPDGGGRADQARAAIQNLFNTTDYDIGHVFHDQNEAPAELPGGGVAYIGAVCGNFKAGGWSGSFDSAPRWYRLVAHEFGHMFGASHTFNGEGGSCSGGNHPQNTAVEIGSGSTIMSYAGICNAQQNILGASQEVNWQFHTVSLIQMIYHVNVIIPQINSCGVSSAPSGNTPPIPDAGNDYAIPQQTPFELTGAAIDAENDPLTYIWEQTDEDGNGVRPTQGKLGADAAADPLAPLFRTFPPSSSPTRIFPSLSSILDGNNNGQTFEALPAVAREINFALTVRDNHSPEAGAVSFDELVLTVADNTGPFEISSQNTSTTWVADGVNTANISWDVANTDQQPINCQFVDILFSTDGGQSFSIVLADSVPNSGSYNFTIPNYPTSAGRIKVKANKNIFFDINNADIKIESNCEAEASSITADVQVLAEQGNSELDLNLEPIFGDEINEFSGNLENSDQSSNLVTLFEGQCTSFGNDVRVDEFTFQVDVDGTYTFEKSGGNYLFHIYKGGFDPGNLCENFVSSSAVYNGSTVSLGNSLSTELLAGLEYVMVVSSFSPSVPGYPFAYTIDLAGGSAGKIYDDIPPPAGFIYTYVIVDESTNKIVDFDFDSDLTSLPGGDYKVYGLSVRGETILNIYIDEDFDMFRQKLLNLELCADLSTNFAVAEIIPVESCEPDGGDLVAPIGLEFPIEICEGSGLQAVSVSYEANDESMPDVSSYDYIFFLTGSNGQLWSFNAAGNLDWGDLPAGTYSLWGLSYKKSNPIPVIEYLQNILQDGNTNDIEQISTDAEGDVYCMNLANENSNGILAQLIVNPAIINAAIINLPESCEQGNGSLEVGEISGGTSPFQYSFDEGEYSNIQKFENLAAGDYSIAIRDAKGCIKEMDFTVNSESGPESLQIGLTPTACTSATGKIEIQGVVGGTAPFEYSLDGFNFAGQAVFENLDKGEYTIYVRDANDCPFSTAVSIISPDSPQSFDISTTPVSCDTTDGEIELSQITGGAAPYIYSLNGVDYQADNTFTGLAVGSYNLFVRDNNGCIAVDSVDLMFSQGPLSIEYDVDSTGCGVADGEITISTVNGGTAPYEYKWENSDFQTANILQNLPADTLQVTIRDDKGCLLEESVIVGQHRSPGGVNLSLEETACDSATGTVQVLGVKGGGMPYLYSLDNTNFQSADTFQGLDAGGYTLYIRDANSCTYEENFTITRKEGPTDFETVVTESACNGSTGSIAILNIVGGTQPYTYAISDNAFQSLGEFDNLGPGVYTVSVKDAGACTYEENVTIAELTGPNQVLWEANASYCGQDNGSIRISEIEGGLLPYQFSISDENNYQSDSSFTNLSPGTYPINVIDSAGCIWQGTAEIEEIDGPIDLISTLTQPGCNTSDGAVLVEEVLGGTPPYLYGLDSLSLGASNLINGLAKGAYTIYVRDSANCSLKEEISLPSADGPSRVSYEATLADCGQQNGSIAIKEIEGGQAPYSFSLNNGPTQTDSTFSDLAMGEYTLSVTDQSGCSWEEAIQIGMDTCKNQFEFVSITAYEVPGRKSRIKWQGKNELAGATYIVEHSVDSLLFRDITSLTLDQTVEGEGIRYEAEDTLVTNPLMFYRILYVAPNGDISTSEVVSVRFREWDTFLAEVWPNPVENNFLVEVRTDKTGTIDLLISDATGRVLHEDQYAVEFGQNRIQFDASGWSEGLYVIRIEIDDLSLFRYIFKQ